MLALVAGGRRRGRRDGRFLPQTPSSFFNSVLVFISGASSCGLSDLPNDQAKPQPGGDVNESSTSGTNLIDHRLLDAMKGCKASAERAHAVIYENNQPDPS